MVEQRPGCFIWGPIISQCHGSTVYVSLSLGKIRDDWRELLRGQIWSWILSSRFILNYPQPSHPSLVYMRKELGKAVLSSHENIWIICWTVTLSMPQFTFRNHLEQMSHRSRQENSLLYHSACTLKDTWKEETFLCCTCGRLLF